MAGTKLQRLARGLKDAGSLRELFSELNFEPGDRQVSTDDWNEKQRASVSEVRLVAKKGGYRVYYVHARTDLLRRQKSVALRIIRGDRGLCTVCTHGPHASRWMFSSRAKKYSKSSAGARHVLVHAGEGAEAGAAESLADLFENTRMDGGAMAAQSVARRIAGAFDLLEARTGGEPACIRAFMRDCVGAISGLDPEGTVKANEFVLMTSRISKRHPFVFVPDFIEDFMDGTFTRTMKKKYQIPSYNDFTQVVSALGLDGKRSKHPGLPNREINLQNALWTERYGFLTSQSRIFQDALAGMYNCSALNALIAYTVLERRRIGGTGLKKAVAGSYDGFKRDVGVLYDGRRRASFERYMRRDLDAKITEAVAWMSQESYLAGREGGGGGVSLPAEYSAIPEHAYGLVSGMKDGISYGSLRAKIAQRFPLLRIASDPERIGRVLDGLGNDGRITVHKSYSGYSTDADQLFTRENYAAKKRRVTDDVVRAGRTKFFGRTVSPDRFVSELAALEHGTLDDPDGQVVRIAGLALGGAAPVRGPGKGFDLTVDLAGCGPGPGREGMVRGLGLEGAGEAAAGTLHCKVMINEGVTAGTLSRLRKAVPAGGRAAVFTCRPVGRRVRQQAGAEPAVLIVDEEGIRRWCSGTPAVPCRRDSVARVMYGAGAGGTVRVRSLDYESGQATVERPDHGEADLPIGCLQEVDLKAEDPEDFGEASERYFEFVCLVADLAFGPMEESAGIKIVAVHQTYRDLVKSTNPEMIGSIDWKDPEYGDDSGYDRYVELDNTHVRINTDVRRTGDSIGCECGHRLNEAHYYTLCRHLVAAIDHCCRDGPDWPAVGRNIDLFTVKLNRFRENNVGRAINAIHEVIGPESRHLVRAYLQKHVDADRD